MVGKWTECMKTHIAKPQQEYLIHYQFVNVQYQKFSSHSIHNYIIIFFNSKLNTSLSDPLKIYSKHHQSTLAYFKTILQAHPASSFIWILVVVFDYNSLEGIEEGLKRY